MLLHRLGTTVIERETPILRGHGLQMWEYVVLSGLEHADAPSQATLAETVGRDQTRLIPLLDGLAERGLLRRVPDPADRRNRIIGLTPEGRALLQACRRSIRAMEADLLAELTGDEREQFVKVLLALVDWHPNRTRGLRRTLG